MITYTEFILFVGLVIAIGYAMFWRHEAMTNAHLFKLMVESKDIREQIVGQFEDFKRRQG